MKKHRNRQLNTTEKTTVTMTGTPYLPLCIGERAWIHTSQHIFTTSMVQKIMEISEIGIRFETCNTIYNLRYESVFKKNEVTCA